MAMQTQILHGMAQAITNMQQTTQNQLPPQPHHHNQSKLWEIMRTKPPTLSHTTEPLDADDWLKKIEKNLLIAQCNGREKVLYATHQLVGPAADYWDAFCNAHED